MRVNCYKLIVTAWRGWLSGNFCPLNSDYIKQDPPTLYTLSLIYCWLRNPSSSLSLLRPIRKDLMQTYQAFPLWEYPMNPWIAIFDRDSLYLSLLYDLFSIFISTSARSQSVRTGCYRIRSPPRAIYACVIFNLITWENEVSTLFCSFCRLYENNLFVVVC